MTFGIYYVAFTEAFDTTKAVAGTVGALHGFFSQSSGTVFLISIWIFIKEFPSTCLLYCYQDAVNLIRSRTIFRLLSYMLIICYKERNRPLYRIFGQDQVTFVLGDSCTFNVKVYSHYTLIHSYINHLTIQLK